MRLWYKEPAESWNEALPLGNGKLGAMVFGGSRSEHVALNADSVWYGGPVDRNNPDALVHLPEIRQLIRDGKIPGAEKLAVKALTGIPENQRHYEPLADLVIDHDVENVSCYCRELLLSEGMVSVEFNSGKSTHSRKYLASEPDQVMAVHLSSSLSGNISFVCQLRRLGLKAGISDQFEKYTHYYDKLERIDAGVLLHGSGGRKGVDFVCGLKAVTEGGTCRLIGDHIEVMEADAVTLYIAAETSFYHAEPQKAVCKILNSAKAKGFKAIRSGHAADIQKFMQRVELRLDGAACEDAQPTDKQLRSLSDTSGNLALEKKFFDFGRYLLIASSRSGSLPANLQGIWNSSWLPSWDSKYTININAQMNYWPAESCALGELHQPLFDHIERMAENGRKTAMQMYGCRGWCAHHNTDIWADTAPQGVHIPSSYWPMGGAWLCLHLWDHYLYSLDAPFLVRVYPLLKGAAKFFLDFLIEDDRGRLITSPSTSPENTYVTAEGTLGRLCQGPSMDSQILYELFTACMAASDILKVDTDLAASFRDSRDRLPKPSIGKDGRLLEWAEEYTEAEPGHRHISHLWALYPGHFIHPLNTPELAQACRRTIDKRLKHGGGHTGWSRAWIINFYARLRDGEEARRHLLKLLSESTYPNLLDAHPPFQIDGNFGAAAAVAEMLVQSRVSVLDGKSTDLDSFEIHLLPALPSAWDTGKLRGLRTRGACVVELEWADHSLKTARVTAEKGGVFNISSGEICQSVRLAPGESWSL